MGNYYESTSKKTLIKPKTFFKFLRIFNIITALLIIVISVLSGILIFINALTSFKFFLVFSPVFMIGFGICLLGAEFKVKYITKRLPFLKEPLTRGLFYIFVSSLVYFYFAILNSAVLAYLAATIVFASGVVYICLHFGCGGMIETQQYEEEEEESDNREDVKNSIRESLV